MHARMRDFIIHWIAAPSAMARNDKEGGRGNIFLYSLTTPPLRAPLHRGGTGCGAFYHRGGALRPWRSSECDMSAHTRRHYLLDCHAICDGSQ